MRDAVRLQKLEDACGVQLAFAENQFGLTAAGALSFNVMAAVAQYYSDNLQSEVLKGMNERVRQGWPTGLATCGYVNVDDPNEPVQPHPEKSRTLIRIFGLYASGSHAFQSLGAQLEREGHVYRSSQPRFHRTALSHILGNRFCIGQLVRNGQVYEGKHRRVIVRRSFDACQDVLSGRNPRTGAPQHPLAGGQFRCGYGGQSTTAERIRRKFENRDVHKHVYECCSNNRPGPDHPRVRWKSGDLERAIANDLQSMRAATPEIAGWFRTELKAAVSDLTAVRRRQSKSLAKRKAELEAMQDRLPDAYLAGAVNQEMYEPKMYVATSNKLKVEQAKVDEALMQLGDVDPASAESLLALFDWTQDAAEIWLGSNIRTKGEIIESVCLNHTLTDVTLDTTKRKPFDVLAEGLTLQNSRGDRI
ncbi:MAG: recombinase family protein [Pirellulales bacterium]